MAYKLLLLETHRNIKTSRIARSGSPPQSLISSRLSSARQHALGGAGRPSANATGLIPTRQSVIDGQINDLLILNIIGIALGSLLLLLALRLARLHCLKDFWLRSRSFGALGTLVSLCAVLLIHPLAFLIALTVAFGIAVDDTIHVLNRMRLTARPDSPLDPGAIRSAFAEISPALLTTTLVPGFGLLGTQSANIPVIQYFGTLTIAVFAPAMLSVLVALPVLIVIVSRAIKSAQGRRFRTRI